MRIKIITQIQVLQISNIKKGIKVSMLKIEMTLLEECIKTVIVMLLSLLICKDSIIDS